MERRLIDANALKEAFEEDGHLSGHIEEFIDDCTAIDAVEVVRCRDCKHRKDPFVCPMCGEVVGEDFVVHDWAEDDGFCHKGERREPDGE